VLETSVARTQSAFVAYSRATIVLAGLCFIFSGATGLIYEILWARMLGLVFGGTTLAVSTVLAAFMGGLALGSALAGRLSARIKRPLWTYGWMEVGVALYALLVPFMFRWVDNLYALIWQQFHPGFFAFSVWRFVLSCLMLLVPTTLMGATLPVLSAALLHSSKHDANSVTRLYACNLAGAIFGTLVAGFVLLPTLGVRTTILIAAAINIIIGVTAMLAERRAVLQSGKSTSGETDCPLESESSQRDIRGRRKCPICFSLSRRFVGRVFRGSHVESLVSRRQSKAYRTRNFWLFCALASGFVTISTQVAWTRILAMIIGSSTYAFSIVVALFLIGLAGGAWLVGRKEFSGKLREAICKIELATAGSLFLSLFVVNWIPALLVNLGLRLQVASWVSLLALQIVTAGLLILLPALLMGTVMPLVLVWASTNVNRSVELVGRSYAVNTIGAIAGAFLTGFLLIPWTSTRATLLFAAVVCVVVAGVAYQPRESAVDHGLHRSLAVGVSAVLIVLLFVFAPPMNLADLSVGAYDTLIRVLAKSRDGIKDDTNQTGPAVHSLLMYQEGPTSTVSVRKDWDTTSMAINGRTNASDSENDMPTQVMLAQAPLLVAPRIDNGLVIGFATGVSVGAILQSPIASVTCVELEPATINGSRYFDHVNHRPLNDPRVRLIIDDARTYLRVTPDRYDIIVSEPSHPWVPGVANLFTQEFFAMGRDRLSEQGVFVQWLQIYQLSTDSLRSVLATFQKVFPHVLVFQVGGAAKGKDLILVGSNTPLNLDRLQERMADKKIGEELARVNLKSESDVRSWYVCDELKLAPAVAGAIINTDDNMHIETTVPREAFRPLMQTNADWIKGLAGK
jgi:spermidine synthase